MIKRCILRSRLRVARGIDVQALEDKLIRLITLLVRAEVALPGTISQNHSPVEANQ